MNMSMAPNMTTGAPVAEFVSQPITRETLALYAQASGDSNPLHLDPAFARQAGFDDVIVHGMLGMALLGRLLTDRFPPWRIRTFSSRFGAPIPVGRAIHCRARTTAVTADTLFLSLEAGSEDFSIVYITGAATIALRDAG